MTTMVSHSLSQKRAREVMGNNIFGVEEAIKHFGVNPSRQQLAYLDEVPSSEEVLKSHKDTHVLSAVFPMSILDIRKVDNSLFCSPTGGRYESEKFASQLCPCSWQLVRKTPVENSMFKYWEGQQALLGKDDETPSAQIMVYTIIGHYKNTGERLFKDVYVRTSSSSADSYGNRVCVGSFASHGLNVYSYWDDNRHAYLGVSTARKL